MAVRSWLLCATHQTNTLVSLLATIGTGNTPFRGRAQDLYLTGSAGPAIRARPLLTLAGQGQIAPDTLIGTLTVASCTLNAVRHKQAIFKDLTLTSCPMHDNLLSPRLTPRAQLPLRDAEALIAQKEAPRK
ncbi:hypothetical protein GQ54DRAFT_297862 [Martensiomyces pterosporus]|nr:hypothetical protein GQ54DRAFT_297862 [Martensiomyces pterosporus]